MLRKHTAVVEIPYSTKELQHQLQGQHQPRRRAGDGTIHKNYNGWIQNLNRGINAQLSAASERSRIEAT